MQHASQVHHFNPNAEGAAARAVPQCEHCTRGLIYAAPSVSALAREASLPCGLGLPIEVAMLADLGLLQLCTCPAGRVWARRIGMAEAAETAIRKEIGGLNQEAVRRRLAAVFEEASVPARYASYTVAGFLNLFGDEGKAGALKLVQAHLDHGHVPQPDGPRPGIYLHGRPGVGKTGLLSPLFMHYVRQGRPGLWVQFNDLMAAVKDFDSGKVNERVRLCQTVEFLMLDDFADPGASKAATDYARDVVFRIVDARNGAGLPTLITSNLDPVAVGKQYHERLARRIFEACAVAEVAGKSAREVLA